MDVIIIGGGVAGFATALALTQSGHTVRVFERRSSVQTLGAGVVLWPNAAFVLDSLGVLPEVLSMAGEPREMVRFDQRGAHLGTLDLSALNRSMGYPSLAILRRDLQAVLARALERAGVQVSLGQGATAFASSERRAEVVLSDRSTASADLIVGADGRMASVARRYVHGANAPSYQGVVTWVGIAELDRDFPEALPIADYWGVGRRFGIVPVSRRSAYWAGAVAAAEPPPSTTALTSKAELEELFREWPSEVRRVIEASALDSLRRFAVCDLEPRIPWHRGRVLLIGDAAHAALPTSGQGACQALEDAWHLARCLPPAPDRVSEALEAFTRRRFDKTSNIIRIGRDFSRNLFHLDREESERRDRAARAADPRRAVGGMVAAWSAGLPVGAAARHSAP